MPIHHAERRVTALFKVGQARVVVLLQKCAQVARDRDRRFVAVLFEEHPLQYTRSLKLVFWNQRRSFAEEPQDRVRFGQERVLIDGKHRYLAVRIHRQERRRSRFIL